MIDNNVKHIKELIVQACGRCAREPQSVTLIAVTKTVSIDDINKALNSGIFDIAENKIQEMNSKIALLPKDGIRKHYIGHLQTNKAKKAVEMFDIIQSVDSFHLADELNVQAGKLRKVQECLIEIKVSGEESKFGLPPNEAESFLTHVKTLKNLSVTGLMAMAPFFEDKELSRPYFKKAKEIFEQLKAKDNTGTFKNLSMGMSNDFEVAIEEGSTMIRVGTAIFKQ